MNNKWAIRIIIAIPIYFLVDLAGGYLKKDIPKEHQECVCESKK